MAVFLWLVGLSMGSLGAYVIRHVFGVVVCGASGVVRDASF